MISTKEKMETSFRNAGLEPVSRENIGDYVLFMGDGFSTAPHFKWQRFGIDPGDFPAGMWVTFWWLGKDIGSTVKLHIGRPLFMQPTEFRKEWRINSARKDAKKALKKLRKLN